MTLAQFGDHERHVKDPVDRVVADEQEAAVSRDAIEPVKLWPRDAPQLVEQAYDAVDLPVAHNTRNVRLASRHELGKPN